MDKRCPLSLKLTPCEECLLGKNLFKQLKNPYCKCKNAKFKENDDLGSCPQFYLLIKYPKKRKIYNNNTNIVYTFSYLKI